MDAAEVLRRAEAARTADDLNALLAELGDTVVLQRNREGGFRVMTVAPFTAWRCDPIDTDTLADGLRAGAQRRIAATEK